MATNNYADPAPVVRRVHAYFAAMDRTAATPVTFDASGLADLALDEPPAPWIALGWIENFVRRATSRRGVVLTGIPAAVSEQVQETLGAEVSFDFMNWTKLTMALATGSQQMNLLVQSGSAIAIADGSTALALAVDQAQAANFAPGAVVVVDVDYTGQTGFVGSPVAGAYVRTVLSDVDYVRRVTLNIGQIAAVNGNVLTLERALPGGIPMAGAKLQKVAGFVDREGGLFVQEWSGLFVVEGSQGERVSYYYPRLQANTSAEEKCVAVAGRSGDGLQRVLLHASFVALPVVDAIDGEQVVCYRSYVPALNAQV